MHRAYVWAKQVNSATCRSPFSVSRSRSLLAMCEQQLHGAVCAAFCVSVCARGAGADVQCCCVNYTAFVCYVLCAAVCCVLLCAVCCVLCAVCCVLCAVCCALCAVCCVLCAVCCVRCAVCGVLCAAL